MTERYPELATIFPQELPYSLLAIINNGIKSVGDGEKVERKFLETILIYECYKKNAEQVTRDQASNFIQILLCRGYLDMSDDNPNPKTELYLELSKKGKELLK